MKIYKRYISENEDFSRLPEVLKKRIERISDKKRKNASAAGYLLLQEALLENGKDINDISFLKTGKPIMPNCFISISHSADLAVCAVSENETGIDTEKLREINEKVFQKALSDDEYKHIIGKEDANSSFITLWTMKEAYKKAADVGWDFLRKTKFTEENGKFTSKHKGYLFKTECFGEYIITVCEKETGL